MTARKLTPALAMIALVIHARGQEPLSAIMDRGYVAHWLVCGPFAPDADGDMVAALGAGRPVLGDTDFMAPLGGMQRVRPKHLDRVRTPQGDAIWQRAGARGPALDLGPFFPAAREGIAYAGFYAENDQERRTLIEVQSHLGVRVYLNGVRVREIANAAFPGGGVDVFPMTFPPGTVFLAIEVPGVSYDHLAEFLGTTVDAIRERHLRGRPLLSGASGYEFAFRVLPAEPLGDLLYVPRLRLDSQAGRAEWPGATLTVHNGADTTSQPVQVVVRAQGDTTTAVVPPIASGGFEKVPVASPTSKADVSVTLTSGDDQATFRVDAAPQGEAAAGEVHLQHGVYREDAARDANTALESNLATLRRHAQLLQEPEYGFDLGPALLWSPIVQNDPEIRATIAAAAIELRTAPHIELTILDERIVSDEVIARNLLYGHRFGEALLQTPGHMYCAWRQPGMAPQTPQLLISAGATGIVSTLEPGGLPPLFAHVALNGESIPHRRKKISVPPTVLDDVRAMAEAQRQELAAAGFGSDILVSESAGASPDAYLLGAADALNQDVPSILLSGAGAEDFFRNADEGLSDSVSLPGQARVMTRVNLGEVIAQPALKAAYGETERLVLMAERAATAATLLGAEYPRRSLDLAWRQLVTHGAPDYVGFANAENDAVDLLAACREAAVAARAVLDASLGYLAGQVDTIRQAPLENSQVHAVVVFNPSPWTRTDVCEVRLTEPTTPGLSIVDDEGHTIACDVSRGAAAPGYPVPLIGRFVARDVPGFGWRTYYVITQREHSPRMKSDALQIENEFFWVTADPDSGGAITSVVDKATGQELSAGLWNDLVLLREGENDAGRGIWTESELERTSSRHARVEVTKHAAVQEIRATAEIGAATVSRTIRLYPGVPRIDCELQVDGLDLTNKLLALASDLDPEGRVPVYGERFGAVVGRRSVETFKFQTRGAIHTCASGLQPAMRWAALAPGDSVNAGMQAVAPVLPASIVVNPSSELMNAAKSLQQALARRGIPCGITFDVMPERNPRWSDSTEYQNANDDLRSGSAMRILLGGPQQNLMTKSVLMQAPESAMAAFNARLAAGVAMYLEDGYVGEGLPPVPTLVLAGTTGGVAAQQAVQLVSALQNTGHAQVPRELFLPHVAQQQAETGLALLMPGAFLSSVESDGSLVALLAHGSDGDASAMAGDTGSQPLTFRYAFLPFAGRWQDAGLARAGHAFAEPFQTVVTDLHPARHPVSQELMSLDDDAVAATAVKPVETPETLFRVRAEGRPHGILLRVYESSGAARHAEGAAFAPLRTAYASNVVESPGPIVDFDVYRFPLDFDPFEVKSLVLVPSMQPPRGERVSLDAPLDAAPHLTTHWRQNRWVSTVGLTPIGLMLESRIEGPESGVRVHISSHSSGTACKGAVSLTAPQDWRLSSSSIPFELAPRGSHTEDVIVMRKFPNVSSGGIIASTELDGLRLYDVVQLDPAPCTFETETSGNRVLVLVRNTGTLPLVCRVEAVAPPNLWPELTAGRDSSLIPHARSATIPVQGQQGFVFTTQSAPAGTRVAIKIAANAFVAYTSVLLP